MSDVEFNPHDEMQVVSPEGYNVWRIRYAGIQEFITRYRQEVDTVSHPYQPLISDLLLRLEHFGRRHFEFFWTKHQQKQLALPSTARQQPWLAYADIEYPVPAFIFWLITAQVANDVLAIRDVFEQRRNPVVGPNRLALADKMAAAAQDSLQAIFPARDLDGRAVQFITFIRRDTNVRTLPYAPAALIGLPLSAAYEGRDLIAVAHEAAHFHYWYGKTKREQSVAKAVARLTETTALQAKFEAVQAQTEAEGEPNPEWAALDLDATIQRIQRWNEEIFADVMSVLIAGPVAAYSMQDLEEIAVGDHFIMDPKSHPTPAIRPLIHAYVLVRIGLLYGVKRLQNAGYDLMARWIAVRKQRNVTVTQPLSPSQHTAFNHMMPFSGGWMSLDPPERISLDDLPLESQLIHLFVDEILALVDEANPGWIAAQFTAGAHGAPKAWTQTMDLGAPFAEFNAWQQSFTAPDPTLPSIQPLQDVDALWSTVVDDLLKAQDMRDPDSGSLLTHADLAGELPPEIWLELMQFASWTTNGPTGRAH